MPRRTIKQIVKLFGGDPSTMREAEGNIIFVSGKELISLPASSVLKLRDPLRSAVGIPRRIFAKR